ncbi:MAG: 2-oxoglutarate oxidoreductase [Candidatus Latescibacteria bacterium 4484_181]|nr:MAG: 2-oxoglutarate oxidoreductase [Candidatus Latescibacteria bacterium 4484_181]RKY67913.1 MAG: 2-oxoglutarate oxidoreductase [Candidatus Latescibacterota bacterium]RKY74021.1 MAG: 2-oxoglutarate oxidoreductase [Candidatus Latescibacterota bacterium]
MAKAFSRPATFRDVSTNYCPGCGHGIIQRLVAEVVDEMGIRERTIGLPPVGCAVYLDLYLDFDMVQPAHGRTPAVATGLKRALPDHIIIGYEGDGGLAAIGTAEVIHAANRGENITMIFVNNAVYGMTGGQMAPTTLVDQKTATTPLGRNPERDGYPLRLCELLATLDGAAYLVRTTVSSPANVRKTKKAIRKAIEVQMGKLGFSMVEVLSPCPTNWGLNPVDAMKWIEEKMISYFPLGEFKTPEDKNEVLIDDTPKREPKTK